MKSKSPFAIKSPLRVQVYGGDTYESPDTVITKTVGEQVGTAITGLSENATKYMDDYKKPEPREKAEIASSIKSDRGQVPERGFASAGKLSTKTSNKIQYIKTGGISEAEAWEKRDREIYPEGSRDKFNKDMRADPSYGKGGNTVKQNLTSTSIYGDGRLISQTPYSPTSMKGSPNKLIGDTMDPYGQPQRGNRDFTFNENEIAPGTLGSQASVGVQKEIFGGGQAQTAAEQLAAEQLQTPLLSKGHGVKQAHTHPTKTTTKISGKGEMPGSSYVERDYVDEDDLEDVGLQRHIATLAQSDSQGTFIKQMPDTGPESNISTAKGFGKKIRLNNMSRPDYTSNEGDQMDPHKFLFQKTPKK